MLLEKLVKKLLKWNRASNVTQAEHLELLAQCRQISVSGKLEQYGYGLLYALYAIQAFR